VDQQAHIPARAVDYIFEILIGLLVWPVAGYMWGRTMWSFYETYFGETQKDDPPGLT
jgi:hypothetical protein